MRRPYVPRRRRRSWWTVIEEPIGHGLGQWRYPNGVCDWMLDHWLTRNMERRP